MEQIQEILYISNKPGTIYFEWGCPHQRGQICLFRPEAILKIFFRRKKWSPFVFIGAYLQLTYVKVRGTLIGMTVAVLPGGSVLL